MHGGKGLFIFSMRNLLVSLLVSASIQLTASAASDHIIVELAPNARISSVAAAMRGEVVKSIPGTAFYLMKVPTTASLVHNPALGVVSAELNDSVVLQPSAAISILETSSSSPAEWYSQQPVMKLIRADKAL